MKTLLRSLLAFTVAFSINAATPKKDIVDIAVENGNFTTLVAAVTAADLVGVLKSEGPFTVFAPTDAAFAALPAGTIPALLNDIPKLTEILLYHVVPGSLTTTELLMARLSSTVEGSEVLVEERIDGIYINDSKIILEDIKASNGVIQVIDAVLLP